MSSYYQLDYLIDLNEKRFNQYFESYHKTQERFTQLIFIYSAIAIYLPNLVQDIIFRKVNNGIFDVCLTIYVILFIASIVYFVRFLIPRGLPFLNSPHRYYQTARLEYEQDFNELSMEEKILKVDTLLKATYIEEIQIAIEKIQELVRLKGHYFYHALILGLLSALPYMICIAIHLSINEDTVQKVYITNQNLINLQETDTMAKNKGTKGSVFVPGKNQTNSDAYGKKFGKDSLKGSTTNLPGINPGEIRVIKPEIIKENYPNAPKVSRQSKKH